MTPLAHRIVKELTLPVKARTFDDRAGLLNRMDDVHSFNVAEIYDLTCYLAIDLHKRAVAAGELRLLETQSFLPAPKTWIEWKKENGSRRGCLLEDYGGTASVRWAGAGSHYFKSDRHVSTLALKTDGRDPDDPWAGIELLPGGRDGPILGASFFLYAALAIINTPRIVGRRQHMPHRGLERSLLARQALVGRFPLHAWTEIVLEVTPPKDVSGDGVHEGRLTGRKCYHWCRAHLRVRLGRLEFVRDCYKGDAALGIRQSRYKIMPPRPDRGKALR